MHNENKIKVMYQVKPHICDLDDIKNIYITSSYFPANFVDLQDMS